MELVQETVLPLDTAFIFVPFLLWTNSELKRAKMAFQSRSHGCKIDKEGSYV